MAKTERISIRLRAQGARERTGELLSQMEELLIGRAANRQSAAKKTAGERKRNARRRQAAAKRAAAEKRAKRR